MAQGDRDVVDFRSLMKARDQNFQAVATLTREYSLKPLAKEEFKELSREMWKPNYLKEDLFFLKKDLERILTTLSEETEEIAKLSPAPKEMRKFFP